MNEFEETTLEELEAQQEKIHEFTRFRMGKKLADYLRIKARTVKFNKHNDVVCFYFYDEKNNLIACNIENENVDSFLELFPIKNGCNVVIDLSKPPDKPEELAFFK